MPATRKNTAKTEPAADDMHAKAYAEAERRAANCTLFVSAVDGRLVTRYGTDTVIGGRRLPYTPRTLPGGSINFWDRGCGTVRLDKSKIVALSTGEAHRYRREYGRALRDGSLIERTRDEWITQTAKAVLAEMRAAHQATGAAKDAAKDPKTTPPAS